MQFERRATTFVAAMMFCCTSSAASLFTTDLQIDGAVQPTQSFSAIGDLIRQFDTGQLRQLHPSYTNNSAVVGQLNLRGMTGATLEFAAGSTALTLSIPRLGITRSFAGATRGESRQQLTDFFKGEGHATLTKILQELVEDSPVDPVAGNPSSLMSTMAAGSFDAALDSAASFAGDTGRAAASAAGGGGSLAIGARFGQLSQREYDSTYYHLPASYSTRLGDSGYGLVVDGALTYLQTDDAEAFSGEIGVGLSVPTGVDGWSLIPSLRLGGTGSRDLGAASIIYAGGLTSVLRTEIGGYDLQLANMVSLHRTADVHYNEYSVSYDLDNVIFRNGLIAERPVAWLAFGRALTLELHAVRTDFNGDALYSRYYNEIGVSLGTRRREGERFWNAMRVGVNHLWGDGDVSGTTLGLGYSF